MSILPSRCGTSRMHVYPVNCVPEEMTGMSFLNIGFSSIGHVLLVELCLLLGHVSGHPASGIVVDARGNIYFIDSGHGVMKLDTKREMTVVQRVPDGHWLTIDEA